MKAMLLRAPSELLQTTVDDSAASPGEVLVRVTHSGVCGTDLKIYRGDIPVAYPRIMGHEMIGTVESVSAVDDDGAGFRTGDRVIVNPVLSCGHCFYCQADQENLCPNGALLGRDRDGGFSDLVSAPVDAVFRLPEQISNNCAPLIQVMTTCHHAQQLADLNAGATIVVIGLGVSGQLHVQLAKARGAAQVIGITGSRVRRNLAEQLGADRTFAPGKHVIDEIRKLTRQRGADVVIDCAGSMSTLREAIELARPGGQLLLFGIYTDESGDLPFYQLYFKELAVTNARAARARDFPACIDLVVDGTVDLDSMISHVLPLADLDKAIRMLDERDEARMKVILEHS